MNTFFRFLIFSFLSIQIFSCNQNGSQEKLRVASASKTVPYDHKPESVVEGKHEEKAIVAPAYGKKQSRKAKAKERAIIPPSFHPTSKEKIFSKEVKDLQAFYQQLKKPAQVFTIDAKKEITIECKEGTRLTIPANSFVQANGLLVKDSVQIEVGEYLSKSDFLLANLSTSSDGQMLESGGMLNIKAQSGGKEVALKKGSSIIIEVPTESIKEDMQLFFGQQDPHGRINWKTQKNPATGQERKRFEAKRRRGFAAVSQVLTLSDTTGKIFDSVQKIHEWADSAKKVEKIDSVEFSFTINRKGEIKNEKIYKNNKFIKKARLRICEYNYYFTVDENRTRKLSFNKRNGYIFYVPGDKNEYHLKGEQLKKIKSKIKETKGPVNVHFKHLFAKKDSLLNHVYQTYKYSRLEENWARQRASYEFLQSDSASRETAKASSYVFAATQLNWINIDRFLKNGKPVNMSVKTREGSYADVKMVFGKINSIMPGAGFLGKSEFIGMPSGEPVTIVAVMMEGNSPYLAIKESTIQAGTIEGLEFKPVDLEEMKQIINRIG